MTNMFKKTLIAAAVAGISTSALAADVGNNNALVSGEVDPVVFSAQGVARVADAELNIDSAGIQIDLNATYADNDVITIEFSGADVDVAASSPTIGTTGAGVIGFLSATDNKLVFRVTDSTAVDANETLTLTGVALDAETVTGDVTVSYSAETNSGLPIDNTGRTSAVVLTSADQFEASVDTAFNATIDVAEQRLLFDDPGTTDVLTLELTDNAGVEAVAAGEVVHTIYGDFSGLVDDSGDALTEAAFVSVAANAASGQADDTYAVDFAEDMQSLTITQTVLGGAVDDLVDVTFDVDGGSGEAATAISTQSFTADVAITDGADPADTFASFESVDAGEWDLNGAEAYIPYMPYGANISQVLYITNNGSQTGDITVDIRDEAGELTSNVSVGQAGPGTTKITGAVLQAVEDATGKTLGSLNATGSEKVSLNIVVNAPTDEVEVYSAYNVGGSDRGLVINSSNK